MQFLHLMTESKRLLIFHLLIFHAIEYESEYIRQIILKVIGEENAKALSKISMCVACEEKDFFKLPIIKSVFERNGKYFFQPNQRDDIESDIIKGTKIASLTKDF